MINANPFSNNRAEYMKELWKYYVPNSHISFESLQPMIVEGGRGTGKTTLFLCNCWREKSSKDKSFGGNGVTNLVKEGFIGLYYKADPSFLSAIDNDYLSEKREGIFNTYFSLEIVKELIGFLRRADKCGLLDREEVRMISQQFYLSVWGINEDINSIRDIQVNCDKALDAIEDVLNSGIQDDYIYPRWTVAGTIIKEVISCLRECENFSDIVVKVYVDEYESFSEWQQKIINTLVKKTDCHIVYNIGVKPKGIKTYETIASNEFLQKTHDYSYFCLDAIIAEGYEDMLREICKKRLDLFRMENFSSDNSISDDIEDYLGRYSTDSELKRFDTKLKPSFYGKLHSLIKEETDSNIICEDLCDNAEPFYARLHLCIMLRNEKYKPSIEDLWQGYMDRRNGVNSKSARIYKEWEHNAKNGIIFLLAKDYHLQKWYYGFDYMVALSSGIVRLFLELCEQIFSIALLNGFEWENASMVSPELQTRAAYYVSRKQIMELETLARYGKQMKIFTLSLGALFRDLHRNDNLTLGEPEPNHFSISTVGEMEEKISDGLDFAIRSSVLQELPQTKEKEVIHTKDVDYHLNKIYAPYFEISCLRKRKIDLKSETISALLSNNEDIAVKAVSMFLRNYWAKKNQAGNNDEKYDQMTIFDLKGI